MIHSKTTFVSIECSAFSGATLLSFLLGTHPQIATVGEMDGLIPRENPDEYLCSCGQRIKECEFWRAVSLAMERRNFEFDTARFDTKFILDGHPLIRKLQRGSFKNNTFDSIRDTFLYTFSPQARQRLNYLVGRNVAFIESVLDVTGKKVFVDSSKDFLRARYLHQYSNLDGRVIHLVRDIRGVVTSQLRRKSEGSIAETANQWVKENKRYQRTLQLFPKDKRLVIRYDDLCLDTEGTLKTIYRFCGVDPETMTTDFMAVSHHIVGNTMRLSRTSEITLDQRWKTFLSQEQLAQIERLGGDLNRQFGYR